VRILNSLVFSFSTTVRAIRDSLREAVHACSASFRIIGSISASKTSCSKVSSGDMDCVGLSGTTSLLSIPRVEPMECLSVSKLPEGWEWLWEILCGGPHKISYAVLNVMWRRLK
jgi:hypothetical protein